MLKRSIDRLQFLRGDFSGSRQGIRPPWSKPEALFTDRCERCGDCISACPEQIIHKGSGGFPVIDFSHGACSFCGDCAASCKHNAFDHPDKPAWQLEVSISDQCLSMQGVVCRSCGDACESLAICFHLKTAGRSQPLIDPNHCNGCGECFSVCPVRCISILPRERNYAA